MEEFKPDINIDKSFLLSALGNEKEILSFKVSPGSKVGDGYMSLIYSIDVELRNKDAGNPIETRNLLLKCIPSHPSRQDFLAKANFFYRESQIYQTWIAELYRLQKEVVGLEEPIKMPFTHVVSAKAIDFTKLSGNEVKEMEMNPLENFIMMEDLRKSYGYQVPNKKEPLDIRHMRLLFPALAKSHALCWVYKNKVTQDVFGKFPFLKLNMPKDAMDSWGNMNENNFIQELKVIEEALGSDSEITKGVKNFHQYMRPLLQVFCEEDLEGLYREIMRVKTSTPDDEIPEPWRVLVHGDSWSGNMLFKYDSKTGRPLDVILIDLQLCREGCITVDLIHSLYTNTTTELRKNHLEELLELYFDSFNDVCAKCDCPSLPGFTLSSFKARFQRGKVSGCFSGLMMYPIVLKDDSELVDLETLDNEKDFGELLESTGNGANVMNPVVTERVLTFVQEMYEEGII